MRKIGDNNIMIKQIPTEDDRRIAMCVTHSLGINPNAKVYKKGGRCHWGLATGEFEVSGWRI